VATGDDSRQPVVLEAGQLVADGVTAALMALAEALGREREGAVAAEPAAEPSEPDPAETGTVARALALPSRAAADVASAVAASLVPAVMARIDVDALLAKVDVEALVHRVDVDRLLDDIEPNRLLERVDLDALVRRVDVGAVAREALDGIDIGEVIQESTAGIGADTVEAVRVQAMHVDDLVARVVDRVLMRRRPRDTKLGGPGA
jgi:hypothetical protein